MLNQKLLIEKLLMCFDIIEINKDRSDAVYSVILLLLYSCDTRAGDTRDGVPELISKDAREEAARGECDCERRGRQEDRNEDVFLREH